MVGAAVRRALVRSMLATAGLGLVAVGVAALATGSAGAAGAALGTGMVCAFFGFGSLVLALVSSVSPAASLLVALLTYTLQVVLVGLVFAALNRSGALGSSIDGGWLAGTLIGGTLVWLGTQIVAHVRTREPLYDLPPNGPQAGAR
jgi:ATP synthase protein I